MLLYTCGINHKTAPIHVRERLSFVPEQLPQILAELQAMRYFGEIAILSTCNRTEFYYTAGNQNVMLDWLSRQYDCAPSELQPYIYTLEEERAIQHLLRVACGLDSMVLGEPQILGQMKQAFATASDVGTIGSQLQRLFQYVFSMTKEIRTSTGIGANPVSVAYAAVNLAKQILVDLSAKTVLMMGAGQTVELTVKYIQQYPIKKLFIINRSFNKAQRLAETYQGSAGTYKNLASLLPEADIIISATNSAIPVLGKGAVESALKRRENGPLYMVDLAVPRDIEPEVADLPQVHLYCIDDLQQIVAESLTNRQEAALQAEKLIELQTQHYMAWLRSLHAVDTIKSFRAKIERIRDGEIKVAQALLQQGSSPEAVICTMARNLTNKFMHTPTVMMKQAGYDQDLELLALMHRLFEL